MARRKHREGESLKKVLGVPALFSTAYGNVGSSIYYALGVVALYAMGATPLVFALTGLLFVTTAWSYAEATAMVPEAGGSSSFARRAFNEFVSFGAGWALMLDYIVTIAISAFFVPHYLAVFWPALRTYPYDTVVGIAVILVLVAINVIGIKEAARLNILLAALDLATQVLIMVIGLVLLLQPRILIDQIDLGTTPTWTQLLYGISIGTIAYTGIETVSNMAEEAANPDKDVPRAINMVLATVLVVYIGMALVALSAMPVGSNTLTVDPATNRTVATAAVPGEPEGTFVLAADPEQPVFVPVEPRGDGYVIPPQAPTGEVYQEGDRWVTVLYGTQLGSAFVEDPVLGVVKFMPDELAWLRGILAPWVGVLAATILVIATNAGLIGVSRLAYSLGLHRQVPPVLGRIHPKRLTPYVAIILFGIVACLLIIPGSTSFLADLYAFGAMISFTTAHVSVVALRIKEPDTPRPFRSPLSLRVRGHSLPLLSIIGGAGTFTVWVVVVATHAEGRLIGFIWMGVGIATYVIYRKAKGYSLTRTIARVVVPSSMQADVDYDRILVPVVGTRITDEMMVLACQLATEKKSAIDALYVIEVPMNLPLDAALPEQRARAERVLGAAGLIAEQFKVHFDPIIVTARHAGRAIVKEAVERRSEVIIMGTVKKRRIADRAFGSTVDHVIDHAPCEVLLNLVQRDYRTDGASLGEGPPAAAPAAANGKPAAGDEAVAKGAPATGVGRPADAQAPGGAGSEAPRGPEAL
ncbi:MAG TPA: amino acid permease [Thermoleophilia bacterium]|nr:amino acid permease [Thermoleophilia bacterium]